MYVQVVMIKLFSSGSGESAGRDSSPESTEVVKPFSDHPSTLQFLIVPSTLELELSCASLSLRWRPSLARLDVSSTQISMPETCGSTAVLVSVTDDLVQVNFQPVLTSKDDFTHDILDFRLRNQAQPAPSWSEPN